MSAANALRSRADEQSARNLTASLWQQNQSNLALQSAEDFDGLTTEKIVGKE